MGTNGLTRSSFSLLLLQMVSLHASLDRFMATDMSHAFFQDRNSFRSSNKSSSQDRMNERILLPLLLAAIEFTTNTVIQPTHNHTTFLLDIEIHLLDQIKHV